MANGMSAMGPDKKKRKLSDKILPQKVRDLVPESQVSLFRRRVLFVWWLKDYKMNVDAS